VEDTSVISKRSSSFLILLSLLTVSLSLAAAQRVPHLPGDRPALPGALPFSLPGQTGQGGMPHRGLSTSVSRVAAPGSIPHTQTVSVHSFTSAEPRPGDY
jgi:hypothetical protein